MEGMENGTKKEFELDKWSFFLFGPLFCFTALYHLVETSSSFAESPWQVVTFLLLGPNTWHLQYKRTQIYFGQIFQRFPSVVTRIQGKNLMAKGNIKVKPLNSWELVQYGETPRKEKTVTVSNFTSPKSLGIDPGACFTTCLIISETNLIDHQNHPWQISM